MIAKIQLKLNNDVLLTVIKMVKHTDDYVVENVTDALLISIKEDLIYKLEDKAKTIQKQVSILDHNKKHSLVLKYHEAYSLFKLLDAVYEKQLFNENLHIKKIKRLITELNTKLDIFAKEEDITIIDEEILDDIHTEEGNNGQINTKLIVEEIESSHNIEQIEIPILFDFTEAFAGEQIDEDSLEITKEIKEIEPVLNTEDSINHSNIGSETLISIDETESMKQEAIEKIAITREQEIILEESVTSIEHFPTQETIYDTESDLFSTNIPNSQPKLDWERITTEDGIETKEGKITGEKVAFSNPKYNELFSIAKTGINVEASDLVNAPATIGDTPPTSRDVMQIEIFDLEIVEADPVDNDNKSKKKKEKKVIDNEQAGQISLF
ncbi:hypothetical protein [Myroides oncorhynchi]|uniref:hypothetical protein n=1 Tax=Myroides oncorhynchi TaxID=2893756 RepID=UPI003AB930F9